MNANPETEFATDALASLRRRLLDLTARNRLLNFTHGRTGNIRVIDELPDELYRLLLAETELRFAAVPDPSRAQLLEFGYLQLNPETGVDEQLRKDPTAAEWAAELGLATAFELPSPPEEGLVEPKHRDRAVQTLMFPAEMEARLRKLRNSAQTAIEETGANICFIAFGFLAWFENSSSDKPRLAPLLLVPVRLDRGRLNPENRTYNYTISYTGEDILANLSLGEMLRVDFGLALPELAEETTPEAYFAAVATLVRKPQPRWRVRRYATVALFNFSKLLMYLDLNPELWPEARPITGHPIVSRFFSSRAGSSASLGAGAGAGVGFGVGVGFGAEHAIDDLPEIHRRYPIIDDADSSQHSALIDVVDGKNLVIEGPPGTGKSQTITNLIAAALAQGKKVLFVAEKLAALEVVKRRLDHAGLGDFCLELHSHKTQKRKVLSDINARLSNQHQYGMPAQIDADIERYEELKAQLRGYAEEINREWHATGLSVHQILMGATRYREELGINPASVHPEFFDGVSFNDSAQRRSLELVRTFADVQRQVAGQIGVEAKLSDHPWFGVGNRDLQLFDQERVAAPLLAWQQALAQLDDLGVQARDGLAGAGSAALTHLDEFRRLLDDLEAVRAVHSDAILAALPRIRGDTLRLLEQSLQLLREIRALRAELAGIVSASALDDPGLQDRLQSAAVELQALGLPGIFRIDQLDAQSQTLAQFHERFKRIAEPMGEIAQRLGQGFAEQIQPTEAGVTVLRDVVELAHRLRPALVGMRNEIFDDIALDELLPALKSELTGLAAEREALAAYFAVDRLPPVAELQVIRSELAETGLFRWISGAYRDARRRIQQLAAAPGVRSRDLLQHAPQLQQFAARQATFQAHPRYRQALGEHFQGTDTVVDDLLELRAWYRAVRDRFGVGFGSAVPLGDQLLTLDATLMRGLQSLVQQGFLPQIDEVLTRLRDLKQRFPGVAAIQERDRPLMGPTAPLADLEQRLRESLGVIAAGLRPGSGANLETLRATGERIALLRQRMAVWQPDQLNPEWFEGQVDWTLAPERIDEALLVKVEHTLKFAQVLESRISTDALRDAIYRRPNREFLLHLDALCSRLQDAWTGYHTQRDQFAAVTELDLDAWAQGSDGTLDGLRRRNQRALDHAPWLANWVDYVRVRYQVEQAGFRGLVKVLETAEIAPEAAEKAYRLGIYDRLAREILKQLPGLASFSGNAHLALQRRFREYDDKLKHLQRQRVAAKAAENQPPEGVAGGKVSNYTELALLRHELGKKRRHVPLRQLVARAGNALAALKPCFMMGPMSVAQYLPRGEIEFDLVVMDEASQMKPEDALGPIARASQLVVVGDPKQLPPTSFFDKMVNEDDEDTTAIEDSESILDTALPIFHSRRLTWHYRSQHEHLIAFSNRSFYDSQLVVFPAPHAESPDFGVKLTRVPGGRFVHRRNIEEARYIAAAVQTHVLERPHESLGVVAMSAEQRDQIERAVEERSKEDSRFRSALEARLETEEPFFIKNLENVQGDERDVIFISCTYGPETIGGRVAQRFGPINSDVGWRRLNVLFTRSKRRMQVFSSMGSGDILLTERSKRGVVAFQEFLAFAETGQLHREGRQVRVPESDFEIAVATALSKAGFECVPRVGVAGFFIDLAVRDPGNPGRYLLGIECDGPTYHAARSVRDRDRLRQAVLERLGWQIRRVWSTDWYRNPQAELEPMIRDLNRLRTPVLLDSDPAASTAKVDVEAAKADAVAGRGELEAGSVDADPGRADTDVARGVDGGTADADAAREVDGGTADADAAKAGSGEVRDLIAAVGLGLRERLVLFDQEVIRVKLPDTPQNQRLLRPAMLEALLEFVPVSKSEFLERVPLYLRQATDTREAQYLDQVLKLIEESETGVEL